MPKVTQKFTQSREKLVNEISRGIWHLAWTCHGSKVQGRNEVYGIRDQRPKKDRDQGT